MGSGSLSLLFASVSNVAITVFCSSHRRYAARMTTKSKTASPMHNHHAACHCGSSPFSSKRLFHTSDAKLSRHHVPTNRAVNKTPVARKSQVGLKRIARIYSHGLATCPFGFTPTSYQTRGILPPAMHPVLSIHDWVLNHPVGTAVITFLLGAIVSIWGHDIREFLRIWPWKKLQSAATRKAEDRLRVLDALHGDSSRLIIYLVLSFKRAVVTWLAWTPLLIVCDINWPSMKLIGLYWPLFMGIAVGQLFEVAEVCEKLFNYEKSRADLRSQLDQPADTMHSST